MDCLDDSRVAILQLVDIAGGILYVLLHLIQDISQVIVVDGEGLLELLHDFLASLHEDCGYFVYEVYLVDDGPCE